MDMYLNAHRKLRRYASPQRGEGKLKLIYYTVQIAIVGGIIYAAHIACREGEDFPLHVAIIIGICLAALSRLFYFRDACR